MRHWLPTVVVISLLANVGCGQATSSQPIYFGLVAPFSGPEKEAGEQALRGLQLALEELNQDESARPFHVRQADTQGSLAAYEALAVRLTAVNRTSALFGGETPEHVSRLARAESLIITAAGHRPPGVLENVFTVGLTPQAQGEALAHFASKELTGKSLWVVVVDDSREDSLRLAHAFEKTLLFPRMVGVRVPQIVQVPVGKNPKWSEVGTRVLLENPQGVVLAGPGIDAALLLAELGKPRLVPVLVGGGPYRNSPATENEPVYAATPFALDKELPAAEAFAKRFRDAFHREPDEHAALAYEALSLVGDVVRRKPNLIQEAREELAKTKEFAGLLGPLSFDHDQQLHRPAAVVRWNGTKATLGKVYSP